MYQESGKTTNLYVYVGIFALLLSLFVQPASAASFAITSSGIIGTTNTSPGYAVDISALDYAPTTSGNLTVGVANEIRYNTIFIGNGIDINILAPDNTSVALIANGDINIAGSLNWPGGNLSLTSISGAFNLSGSIAANSLTLSAGTVSLENSGKIAVLGGNTPISNGDIQLATSGEIVLSTVPLPPALWLFGSGLLGLMGISQHRNLIPCQAAGDYRATLAMTGIFNIDLLT